MARTPASGAGVAPRTVTLDGWGAEAYPAWRAAARRLLAEGVPPERVAWREADAEDDAAPALTLDLAPDLALDTAAAACPTRDAATSSERSADAPAVRVPRRFLDLAEAVACHADPARWALLYRTLWRLVHGAPQLLDDHADADVARLGRLAKAVGREVHKLHAFVRFRAVADVPGDTVVGDVAVNDVAVNDVAVNDVAVGDAAAREATAYDVAARDAAASDAVAGDIAVRDDAVRDVATSEIARGDASATDASSSDAAADAAYVAWFEPTHDVLARAAPFFARRFPHMRWAILTPRRTIRWDGRALHLGPGLGPDAAPPDDAHEALWRTYYAHVFNPARVKLRAMRAEMPVRYWRNLPEAALVPALVREAPERVAAMLARARADEARRRDAARAGAAPVAAPDASTVAPDAPAPGAPPADATARDASPRTSAPRGVSHTADAASFDDASFDDAPTAVALADGGAVRVGTASWTDPTLLVPGLFYPPEVATPEARLRFYASRYPLVEVDSTYYALPTRRVAELWAERTPPGFVFDVKAHALMTGHPTEPRRLPRAVRELLPPSLAGANRIAGGAAPAHVVDAVWERFTDALAPLVAAGKLGALLLQLPRDFRPTRAAADVLRAMAERLAPLHAAGVTGAIEFRHRDWFDGRLATRTLALLERLALAHVIVDAPPGFASSMPFVAAVTSPRLAVVRLHGRRTETWERPVAVVSERYRYLYDASELERHIEPIVDVARRTQGVHVVFNNCHADYGTRNAAELTALLRRRDALRRVVLRGAME